MSQNSIDWSNLYSFFVPMQLTSLNFKELYSDLLIGIPFAVIPLIFCILPVFFIQPLFKKCVERSNKEDRIYDSEHDDDEKLKKFLKEVEDKLLVKYIGSSSGTGKKVIDYGEKVKCFLYIFYHTIKCRIVIISIITLFISLDSINSFYLLILLGALCVDILIHFISVLWFFPRNVFEYMMFVENSFEKKKYKYVQMLYLLAIILGCLVWFVFSNFLFATRPVDFSCVVTTSQAYLGTLLPNMTQTTQEFNLFALPFLTYFYDTGAEIPLSNITGYTGGNATFLQNMQNCGFLSGVSNLDFYKGGLCGILSLAALIMNLIGYNGPSNNYYCDSLKILRMFKIPFPFVYIKTQSLLFESTDTIISDVVNLLYFLKASNEIDFPESNSFTSHYEIDYFQFMNSYELGFLQYFFTEFMFKKCKKKEKKSDKKSSNCSNLLFILLKYIRFGMILVVFVGCIIIFPVVQYFILSFLTLITSNFIYFFFLKYNNEVFFNYYLTNYVSSRFSEELYKYYFELGMKVVIHFVYYTIFCFTFFFLYKFGILNERVDIMLKRIKIYHKKIHPIERFIKKIVSSILNFFFFFSLPAVITILAFISYIYENTTYFDYNMSILRFNLLNKILKEKGNLEKVKSVIYDKAEKKVQKLIEKKNKFQIKIETYKKKTKAKKTKTKAIKVETTKKKTKPLKTKSMEDVVEDVVDLVEEVVEKIDEDIVETDDTEKAQIIEFFEGILYFNTMMTFFKLIHDLSDHDQEVFHFYLGQFHYVFKIMINNPKYYTDESTLFRIKTFDNNNFMSNHEDFENLRKFQFHLGRKFCKYLLSYSDGKLSLSDLKKEIEEEDITESAEDENERLKKENSFLYNMNVGLKRSYQKLEKRFEDSMRAIKENETIVDELSEQIARPCIKITENIEEAWKKSRENKDLDVELLLEESKLDETEEKEKKEEEEEEEEGEGSLAELAMTKSEKLKKEEKDDLDELMAMCDDVDGIDEDIGVTELLPTSNKLSSGFKFDEPDEEPAPMPDINIPVKNEPVEFKAKLKYSLDEKPKIGLKPQIKGTISSAGRGRGRGGGAGRPMGAKAIVQLHRGRTSQSSFVRDLAPQRPTQNFSPPPQSQIAQSLDSSLLFSQQQQQQQTKLPARKLKQLLPAKPVPMKKPKKKKKKKKRKKKMKEKVSEELVEERERKKKSEFEMKVVEERKRKQCEESSNLGKEKVRKMEEMKKKEVEKRSRRLEEENSKKEGKKSSKKDKKEGKKGKGKRSSSRKLKESTEVVLEEEPMVIESCSEIRMKKKDEFDESCSEEEEEKLSEELMGGFMEDEDREISNKKQELEAELKRKLKLLKELEAKLAKLKQEGKTDEGLEQQISALREEIAILREQINSC